MKVNYDDVKSICKLVFEDIYDESYPFIKENLDSLATLTLIDALDSQYSIDADPLTLNELDSIQELIEYIENNL